MRTILLLLLFCVIAGCEIHESKQPIDRYKLDQKDQKCPDGRCPV